MNQQDRQLTISGERRRKAAAAPGDAERDEDAEPASRQQRRERRFGKFKRQVKLPETADCDAVSARCAAPCPADTWVSFLLLPLVACAVLCAPSARKPGERHSRGFTRKQRPLQVQGTFISACTSTATHMCARCADVLRAGPPGQGGQGRADADGVEEGGGRAAAVQGHLCGLGLRQPW